MTGIGIGEALQYLIDTLQIEGHELLRVFTEVQFALAVYNFIIVIGVVIGSFAGLYIAYKLTGRIIQAYDIDSYDEGITKICILALGFFGGLIISLLTLDAVMALYLYHQYPQYYAAKELIENLATLT